MTLEQIVNHKRVIIVGKASCLFESPIVDNQGSYIDSYDVVIRVRGLMPDYSLNNDIPLLRPSPHSFIPVEYQDVLGTKTNVYCLDTSNHWTLESFDECLESFKNTGGKLLYLIWKRNRDDTGFVEQLFKKFEQEIHIQAITHNSAKELYRQYRVHGVPGRLGQGQIILHELLATKAREIKLIGFTFSMSPFDFARSMMCEHGKTNDPAYMTQLKWFIEQMDRDSRIKIDKHLQAVIHLHNQNINVPTLSRSLEKCLYHYDFEGASKYLDTVSCQLS